MPGLDRTGPLGWGRMTGRGRGLCPGGGYSDRSYFQPVRPLGFGRRRGQGFGGRMAWQAGYASGPTREIEMLRSEAADLKQDLERINRRIEELEQRPSES